MSITNKTENIIWCSDGYKSGFIYCLANPSMENAFLIGYASYDVDIQEVLEMVSMPYVLHDLINDVEFPQQAMAIIYNEVREQRINPKFGFFRCNKRRISDAFAIIRKMIRNETLNDFFQKMCLSDSCINKILLS